MTSLKTDSAKLWNKNEVFMARRVIPAELLNKETEMQFSVYVRQILLKNQTKKISSSYTKNPPPPHKTTVHHKDNKLRRQHCDMVAVCARQTVFLVSQTLRVHAETFSFVSAQQNQEKTLIKGNVLF